MSTMLTIDSFKEHADRRTEKPGSPAAKGTSTEQEATGGDR